MGILHYAHKVSLCLFKKSLGYSKSVSTALPPQALVMARSSFHPGSVLHTGGWSGWGGWGSNIHLFTPRDLLWSRRAHHHQRMAWRGSTAAESGCVL